MPLVKVEMMPGRTRDQKKRLAKAIAETVAEIAITKPEEVFVVFDERPAENWAQGGVLAGD